MKIFQKIEAVFAQNKPDRIYTFITFSASLIFGIFAWRQRLLLFPVSFSVNICGNTIGSHVFFYLLSFLEVLLYAFGLIFLMSRTSLEISHRCQIPFKEVFQSLTLNCLWFYLLPINFYLTNGYTQGYPNHLLSNSHNPYLFDAPLALPMDFIGTVI
jgi:hypothetical protein